jgi:hypothetical protein
MPKASSTSNNVEDEKILETSAVVRNLPDALKAHINNLHANCDNGGKVRQIIRNKTIIAIITH